MASFKEIKERINSVRTTRKITSAMKMVSAAKLHKAQKSIAGMLPYSYTMERILGGLLSSGEEAYVSSLSAVREPECVAVVAFSSDSALAGAFNSNVWKEFSKTYSDYKKRLPAENIKVYTVGKKIFDAANKTGIRVTRNYVELAAKPDYAPMAALAEELIEAFERKELDRVEIIYHHFKSAGSQTLVRETFLPFDPATLRTGDGEAVADYILEPSRDQLLATLIPRAMKLKLYTALLDSNASEHAARVIAMQTATDNADELLGELDILYNKSRQQAITNELLDMIGGSVQ